MGTTDTLVDDLLAKPKDAFRDELVRRALAGAYHDFKSDHPTPKVALVGDLVHYGYRDLARKARAGAYDDHPDADDEAMLATYLDKDPVLADINARFQAKEITFEEATREAMQSLSPEDQDLALAEVLMHGSKR